jgi:hypothetical protein
MRGARYVRLIPWTLRSGSEQKLHEIMLRNVHEGALKEFHEDMLQEIHKDEL